MTRVAPPWDTVVEPAIISMVERRVQIKNLKKPFLKLEGTREQARVLGLRL